MCNNGNIAFIADNVNPGWTQSFTYDGLNRLLTGARSDGGYNHTYNYDSFGNLLIQDNINPGPTYSINNATNQLNRINPVTQTSLYAYDAAGNLTSSDTSMGTGTSSIGGHTYTYTYTYTYNALSQITAVDSGSTASYIYNGDDQRAYKLTSGGWTDYLYFQGQPVAEQSHDATTGATEWTDYIYANGQKIAKIATPSVGTPTLNYYLDDHLGTTQVELDAFGTVTWQGQFTPFGTELPDGSTTMHYKFTGKERDAETGLDYFGARYYGSAMGRWVSPDWSEKPEEVPYSSLADPQSLNLYNYVGNNPLSKADADGHCDWCQKFKNFFNQGLFKTDAQTKAYYEDQLKNHPITPLTPAEEQQIQQLNVTVSMIMIGQVGGEGTLVGQEIVSASAAESTAINSGEVGLSQVQINNAAGKAYQDGVAAQTAATDSNVVQNLKVRTDSGVNFEIDVASTRSSGAFRGQEAKASATAPLTQNQATGHPEMARSGATVVSRSKPGYPAGSRLPPTKIEVVRPKQ